MKKFILLCCASISALQAMEESSFTSRYAKASQDKKASQNRSVFISHGSRTNNPDVTPRMEISYGSSTDNNQYDWNHLSENSRECFISFAQLVYKDRATGSTTPHCLAQLVTEPSFLKQFVKWIDHANPEQANRIFRTSFENRNLALTKAFSDFGYSPDQLSSSTIQPQLHRKKIRLVTLLKLLPFEQQMLIACLTQQDQPYIKSAPIPEKLKKAALLLKETITGEQLFGELLLEAIRIGNSEAIKPIFTRGSQSGLTINFHNEWGETPLLFATRYNRVDFLRRFIAMGADLNAKNGVGCTALMVAAWCGYKHIVKLLLKSGAETHAGSNQGWTALMAATQKGHKDIVNLLIKKSFMTLSGKADLISIESELNTELIKLPITSWASTNKICSRCSKEQSKFMCSGCRLVYYCSRKCQKKNWGLHEPNCKK